MTLKMGLRSQTNIIIVKYLQHVTYVSRNSLTLLGVKIIATNANNNVDVIACFT